MIHARKPLPDLHNVHALGMGDLTVVLRNQFGMPLHELIDLSPQQLYDVAREFAEDEEVQSFNHLVVIDDETGEALKELVRRTVERLRPKHRIVAHIVSIQPRSVALEIVALDADMTISLAELDKRLWDATGEPAVVLEDDDFAAYGIEMNRIISARPHGRSRALDVAPAESVDVDNAASDNATRDSSPSARSPAG